MAMLHRWRGLSWDPALLGVLVGLLRGICRATAQVQLRGEALMEPVLHGFRSTLAVLHVLCQACQARTARAP